MSMFYRIFSGAPLHHFPLHNSDPVNLPSFSLLCSQNIRSRINPVKVLIHVFPSVHATHIAVIAFLLMIYIFISDVKALVYSGLKTFFHSILSIFFRSVDVVGRYGIFSVKLLFHKSAILN